MLPHGLDSSDAAADTGEVMKPDICNSMRTAREETRFDDGWVLNVMSRDGVRALITCRLDD